ncbi:MAG: hypothetical protein KC561_01835, partial [Myxococcales bacterium]|nr:hypothetical protein [Myxococcales bacterium]
MISQSAGAQLDPIGFDPLGGQSAPSGEATPRGEAEQTPEPLPTIDIDSSRRNGPSESEIEGGLGDRLERLRELSDRANRLDFDATFLAPAAAAAERDLDSAT